MKNGCITFNQYVMQPFLYYELDDLVHYPVSILNSSYASFPLTYQSTYP